MAHLLLNIYDYLSKRKPLAVALLLALLLLGVFLSLRLRYVEDVADFLPQNEANRRYTSVYNNLGDQGEITVIFRLVDSSACSGDWQLALMDAVDVFGRQWDSVASDGALEMPARCHSDDSQVFDAMDYIRQHVALFLTAEDYQRMDSLLRPGYVDSCMGNIRQLMAFPLGSVAVEAIANDPLNLFSPALKRLSQLSVSDRFSVVDGYVFDEEGRAYAFLTSPYPSSDTKNNSRVSEKLEQAMDGTMSQCGGVSVSAVGAPLIAVTNARQIKKDSLVSILMAALLIMGILIYAMGRKRNIFWLAASILFGWLMALAVIALFKTEISIIVIGIGSVLLGIAVNYPLHFLDHLCDHPDRRSALKDMIDPLLTGNVTTVSAFACLLFVKAEAMRDLGLFGALMLVGTIVFVMVFLPLLAKPGRRGTKAGTGEERCPVCVARRKGMGRGMSLALFLLVCAVTGVLGYFSTRTSFDSDLRHINYMTGQQRADLQLLNNALEDKGGLLYIVSEDTTLDGALASNERVLASHRDVIRQANGPVGILPSMERQRESLRGWSEFMGRHPELAGEVVSAARKAGFAEGAFDDFLSHLRCDYDPVPVEEMERLQEMCGTYLLKGDSTVRVVTFARVDEAGASGLKEAVNNGGAASFAFDTSDVGSHLVSALNEDFNYILYVCGFVVFFFLWLSLGRLELAVLSFIPLTVGWLWILGLMDIFAVKFNIVNIILATFIFGQGDDYTIFITEGLMYEYAYGQRRLKGYRRSVILSALLMFVGIGALIFAKHPAMRSLAEVAVIGMATVLLMACYLPPLIFRWLTEKKGKLREVPMTFKRIVLTFWILLVFFVAAFVLVTPYTVVYGLIGKDTETKRLRFHRLISFFAGWAVRHLPGVNYRLTNPAGEDFEKPAVIIANHQSPLDLLCVLSLTPKMVILTKDWVWRNPVYGIIIRYAEFCSVSNGYESNFSKLRSLMERGYSVMVFPEGTRSLDGRVARFRKGAFQLAQQCGADIVPVYLHGTNHVMSKGDGMLRDGSIDVRVGTRIPAADMKDGNVREMASRIREEFVKQYEAFCQELEDEHYFLPLVRYQYVYKGRDVARRSRRTLKMWLQDNSLEMPGQGEVPLLKALAHPDRQFEYVFHDEDDFLVASHCAVMPPNLHYRLEKSELEEMKGGAK
ncbi:MAG: 1-acyl-sn-glycerol-3-phosphate acyltransferase [Bacteroidales bacterium]|nr:1-acyl-sn-glycerol-3-phosphate acyltransferase [Bacteroidales bacterium]